MAIKACLFDLDGVIVDTAKYHYLAWRELAAELGFDFTLEHNEMLKGVSRMESLEILLNVGGISLNNDEKAKLADKKNKRYVSFISIMAPHEILPGVLTFLEEIKMKGIKTAIGSASKNTPLILERLSLQPYFDVVIDGNSVEKAKPDPEVFLKGAHALGIDPQRCIVFEDALAGVNAALNGGMWCIGIGEQKNLPGAHWVIEGFDGLSIKKIEQELAINFG
jgi:beta-phosphoglucomutase